MLFFVSLGCGFIKLFTTKILFFGTFKNLEKNWQISWIYKHGFRRNLYTFEFRKICFLSKSESVWNFLKFCRKTLWVNENTYDLFNMMSYFIKIIFCFIVIFLTFHFTCYIVEIIWQKYQKKYKSSIECLFLVAWQKRSSEEGGKLTYDTFPTPL